MLPVETQLFDFSDMKSFMSCIWKLLHVLVAFYWCDKHGDQKQFTEIYFHLQHVVLHEGNSRQELKTETWKIEGVVIENFDYLLALQGLLSLLSYITRKTHAGTHLHQKSRKCPTDLITGNLMDTFSQLRFFFPDNSGLRQADEKTNQYSYKYFDV